MSKTAVAPGIYRAEYYDYTDSILSTTHDLKMYQNIYNLQGGSSSYHASYSDFNFEKRYYHSGLKRLASKYVSERNSDGRSISITEDYVYDNPDYPLQITSKEVTDSKGWILRTDYKYAHNLTGSVYTDMVEKNMVGIPIEEKQTNISQSKELSKMKREYGYFQPNPSVPAMVQLQNIQTSSGGAPLDTDVMIERYDSKGHILQHTRKDGLVTSYIYGYGQLYPVARIVGSAYTSAIGLVNQGLLDNSNTTDADLRSHLSALRTGLPGAQVTTYTYKPGVGITSQTDPRGYTSYFEYDSSQRLKGVKDEGGFLQKGYRYHYRP